MMRNSRLRSGLALYLALAATWLLYAPGLGGEFIFDDYPNLSGLSQINADPGLASYSQYLLGGVSSSLGRPLSVASFALQHDSWPRHPEDFLRANILLHLLNGALLCWCLLLLFRLAPPPRGNAEHLAIAATLVWLISPLSGGAVLYIVQRMTVLAGTCMLAGFLLYLIGRQRLNPETPRAGLTWMSGGIGVGLGLGVLAKENAVLFPLLVLITEFTLLAERPRAIAWSRWAAVFLGIPLAALAGYLLWRLPGDWGATSLMGVTTPERLLSQPRVLFLYLQKLLLPDLFSIRIMYDDLPVSRSLLTPWTTWASVLGWALLASLAWAWRRRAPLFVWAIFWFLGCHALESSFIPLEIAFDHRNYLASVGVVVALVCGAAAVLEHPQSRRIRAPIYAGLATYVVLLGFALWQSANLWGRPYEMMAYWGMAQPDSRRVSFELADAHFRNYHPLAALQVHRQALERWPGETTHIFGLMGKVCVLPDAEIPAIEKIERSLAQYDGHTLSTLNLLDRLIKLRENGLCDRYGTSELRTLVDMTFGSAAFRGFRNDAHHIMLARLLYLEGDLDTALSELDQALALKPDLAVFDVATQWSVAGHRWSRARAYAAAARKYSSRNPFRRWLDASALSRLEAWIPPAESAPVPAPQTRPDIAPHIESPGAKNGSLD